MTTDEIKHQITLLETHRRNLQHYLGQKAQHGTGYIPPIILNGILEERKNIRRVKQNLVKLNHPVADLPDDKEEEVSSTPTTTLSFRELKRKTLLERRELLFAQYKATSDQLLQTLSSADRLRLQRQIESLEGEINQVENEMNAL